MTRTELINASRNLSNLYSKDASKWERLYNCTAWTRYIRLGDTSCVVLKSYNTIVALYSTKTGTVYEFDRYSATTSQHVRKFAHYVNADRITKLHKDTTGYIEILLKYPHTNGFKPTKEEWKNVIDTDYSLEIESFSDLL